MDPCINPFRTAVPFWGHTTQIVSDLSPKRDCGPLRVNSIQGSHRPVLTVKGGGNNEIVENARTVITKFAKSSIDRSVELTADVHFCSRLRLVLLCPYLVRLLYPYVSVFTLMFKRSLQKYRTNLGTKRKPRMAYILHVCNSTKLQKKLSY